MITAEDVRNAFAAKLQQQQRAEGARESMQLGLPTTMQPRVERAERNSVLDLRAGGIDGSETDVD